MPSYNKITIIGNMGADPSIKDKSTYVSVATNESWRKKDSEEWQEKVSWHKVLANGYVAEKLNGLKKGTTILVEGKLDYFVPKEEGEVPASFIKADKILNMSHKPKENTDDIPY